LPTHWLGRALGLLLSLDELLVPEPIEPEPLAPAPEVLPVAGLVVELPGLVAELPVLPEVCAHEGLAKPSSAAATAALSVFTITMYAPLVG
jgi:hypothetical protein